MAGGLARVLGTIRTLVGDLADVADGDLLLRFIHDHDQSAFGEIMRRHGPLVMGACKRLAHHQQDAEDAFQAVFLVLARRATTLNAEGSLGPWLYAVACKTALKARCRTVKRQERETNMDHLDSVGTEDACWDDLRPVLDEEVNQLPDVYRATLVLCCLQGKATAEAARELGCPLGTVLSRLARGREMLRERLQRRGVAVLSTAITAGWAERASASVSASLYEVTLRTATLSMAETVGGSTGPMLLAKEVAAEMASARLRRVCAAAACLCLCMVAAGFGVKAILRHGNASSVEKPRESVTLELVRSYGPLRIEAAEKDAALEVPIGFHGAFAVIPDGKKMYLGDGRCVAEWTVENAGEVDNWLAHDMHIVALALSRDGTLLASGSIDGVVKVWDLATRKTRREARFKRLASGGLCFLGNGEHLAVAEQDGIMLIDLERDTPPRYLPTRGDQVRMCGLPNGALLWSDGFRLVRHDPSAGSDTLVWRQGDRRGQRLGMASFSENGNWLVTAQGTNLHLVDTRSGQNKQTIAIQQPIKQAPVVSKDGSMVAYAITEEVIVWDTERDRRLQGWEVPPSSFRYLLFVDPGSRLACATNKSLRMWNVDDGQAVALMPRTSKLFQCAVLGPRGDEFATVMQDGKDIVIWDVATGERRAQWSAQSDSLHDVAYAMDPWMVTSAVDGVRVWDRSRKQLVSHFPKADIHFGLSPDGSLLAMREGKEIVIHSLIEGKTRHRLKSPNDWIWSMAFDVDLRYVAVTGYNPFLGPYQDMPGEDPQPSLVVLWDLATGKEIHRLPAQVDVIAFHPEGKLLFGLEFSGSLSAWDIASGRQVYQATTGMKFGPLFRGAGFSPDGRLLAIGSTQFVKLYSLMNGALLGTTSGDQDRILGASFSRDSTHLITYCASGRVMLWRVAWHDPIAQKPRQRMTKSE